MKKLLGFILCLAMSSTAWAEVQKSATTFKSIKVEGSTALEGGANVVGNLGVVGSVSEASGLVAITSAAPSATIFTIPTTGIYLATVSTAGGGSTGAATLQLFFYRVSGGIYVQYPILSSPEAVLNRTGNNLYITTNETGTTTIYWSILRLR